MTFYETRQGYGDPDTVWHSSIEPCPQYGREHGNCRRCADAWHADTQRMNTLALALQEAGYLVTVTNLGGGCMGVCANLPSGGFMLATTETADMIGRYDDPQAEEPSAFWEADDEAVCRLMAEGETGAYVEAWKRLNPIAD